jgi:hypothetical protein
LSSSGGGLFDERPKTQTWVWDVFVLAVFSAAFVAKTVGRGVPPSFEIIGHCPSGCANPKGCTSLAALPADRRFLLGIALTCSIHAGYGISAFVKKSTSDFCFAEEIKAAVASTSFPQDVAAEL